MSPPIGFTPPTSEEIAQLYRKLGTDEESIRKAKETLLAWLKAQPHLPDTIDDCRVEHLYLNNKCSLDRSIVALDAYFSLRTRLPELLQNRDPLQKDMQAIMDVIMVFPMPRLTPEGYRVQIISHIDPKASHFDAQAYLRLLLMMLEVRLGEDCVAGDVLVADLSGFSEDHFNAVGDAGFQNYELCAKVAYGSRIKALHYINPSHVMDHLYKKTVHNFTPKLAKRANIHHKQETVCEHLPSECVPNELGGTGGPAIDHWEAWKKKLISYRDWFLEQDKFVSDETKRIREIPYENVLLGSEGK